MTNIEFAFTRPWLLLLLIPALALLLIPFFRLRPAHRKTFRKISSLVLHCIAAVLLVAVIAGFHFVSHSGKQSTLLLVDLSDSTKPVKATILDDAERLLSVVDEETPAGVIAFGQDQLFSVTLEETDKTVKSVEVIGDATNLSEALRFAAEQFPTDRAKHVILLSDGIETDGDAATTASDLAARGIRVDTVHLSTLEYLGTELQITSFTAPEAIYLGESLHFTAEIESNVEAEVGLRLSDNNVPIDNFKYQVLPGTNIFELTLEPEQSGTHVYDLLLQYAEDTVQQNNKGSVCVDIKGSSKILIIADSPAETYPLEDLLDDENTVDLVSSVNAPNTIVELCKYDEIILVNAHADDLPWRFEELLKVYVSKYGKTLLTVGGNRTYMYGNMSSYGYEDLLPITFALTEAQTDQPVALMLVLDCSQSMASGNLSLAKQGAIKCVDAMTEKDYVGVISFNSSATVRSPLVIANKINKETLSRTISALSISHGTYYTHALRLACEELKKSSAPVKHVIFLSDGQPGDSGYYDAAEDLRANGITVSTIGIRYTSDALTGIAQIGAGRNYYVQQTADLPNVMLSEAKQASVSNLILESFQPKLGKHSDLTAGIEEASLPMLNGYIGATQREEAVASLLSDDGKPLFVQWKLGEGTVASFMSDLTGEWSEEWMKSEVGQELIRRMVSTTLGTTHADSTLTVGLKQFGKTAEITVETAGDYTEGYVAVDLVIGTHKRTYYLNQEMKGIFVGTLPTESAGIYTATIVHTQKNGSLVDFAQTTFSVPYSKEYQAFADGGKDLLTEIAELTGGKCVSGQTEEYLSIANALSRTISFAKDPSVALSIIAAVLLLCDIAIRKLRWKDIQYHLDRIFHK